MKYAFFYAALIAFSGALAQNTNESKFKQLGQELPTPNVYRTASGAPGPNYYQQKADYVISIELDDENQKITGSEKVTYTNNSPDPLNYLWIQLDQNKRAQDSDSRKISKGNLPERVTARSLDRLFYDFDGGFKIESVTNTSNKALPYTINNTMMRIDLEKPLLKGQKVSFNIKWWYNINDRMKIGGRSGLEYFPAEDNYLYTIAQFFPRMAVYNDVEGWQNKQFLGSGEFTLPFGDYTVNITVPADHVVGATGKLQNASSVLTSAQRNRWTKAQKSYDTPVMIVTPEEALEAEKTKSTEKKTWTFKATNVRDFAFASSRKFIWDAMAVDINGRTVMAVSYYPKEGNPLWEKYSTRVVAHTVKTYSKFTIDYPYHKAISVHANRIGMEYPMICFNGGRPEADGTYS
ncbi:MAG: M1 family peptidase, partial [Schleiferiaceae bacterium]|nr:M1 family peptidase [Schleiferiaceae bacterium]